MAGETITLAKDTTFTGISNVREATITTTYTEIDKTKKGDAKRTVLKGWATQTLEVTCVDSPGCSAGSVITVSTNNANGHNLSAIEFLVTSVSQSEPLDDIITYTVSATRGIQTA
jgi:hypothetical protein